MPTYRNYPGQRNTDHSKGMLWAKSRQWKNQVKESNFRLAGGGGRARDYKRLKSYPNQSQRKDCVYILTLRIRKRKGKRSNMYANVKLDICTINVDIYSRYLFFKLFFFPLLSKLHAHCGA